MDIFLQASREKLRIQTPNGPLSVEQLWDLSTPVLDTLAVSLEEQYNTSGAKSFIKKRSAKDATAKLKFDVVLTVLETKVEEEAIATQKAENKKHNDKIFAALEKAEENELSGKTPAQLRKMLREE